MPLSLVSPAIKEMLLSHVFRTCVILSFIAYSSQLDGENCGLRSVAIIFDERNFEGRIAVERLGVNPWVFGKRL